MYRLDLVLIVALSFNLLLLYSPCKMWEVRRMWITIYVCVSVCQCVCLWVCVCAQSVVQIHPFSPF